MKTHSLFCLAAMCAATVCPATAAFSVKDAPAEGRLDILEDGRLVGRYMYGRDKSSKNLDFDTAKTYLHVFDAEGKETITKGPGGELPHHRGIFIGWNKLTVGGKADDLWHMKGSEQLHQKFVDEKVDDTSASITSLVTWKGKSGATLLEERRTMTFRKAPAPAYLLVDFTSTLTATAGEAKLEGDPEHAGLQFRPANEVDRGKTRFLFPKAEAVPLKDLDYPWVVESYVLRGKTYNVAFLNHPENPTGTRFSAYRDYGRFGAFYKTAVPKESPLTLKVRFVVGEGQLPEAAWIQEQANAFTGKSDPVPPTTLKESKAKSAPAPKK
ncbi:PmoA family protein [Luteolibacter sp. SL250]|uniref:DUF6807 family protein n=1 Tax=Luteolibacter sp. SL250 TaxID=2995170 RepID=UPI00226DAB77|nr:DUF6807 family protein [Luteolibacter sp. SL250]WAC21032.1 PmoA family protein [Luteolibacter sp. SL250]